MPRSLPHKRFVNFTGGLNLTATPTELGEDETPDCANVHFETKGSVRVRRGTTHVGNSGFSIVDIEASALGVTWGLNEPVKLVFGAIDTATPATTSAVRAMDYNAATGAFTLHDAGFLYNATDFRGPPFMIAVPGVNREMLAGPNTAGTTYRFSDDTARDGLLGTGFNDDYEAPAADSMPPGTRDGCHHADRLFIVAGQRLRWSHVGLLNFHTDDWIDPTTPDGQKDELTGVARFRDHLIIFSRRHCWALYGFTPETFSLTYLAPVGTYNSHTKLVTRYGVMFWHEDEGVYLYDGGSVTYLFDKLFGLIDSGEMNLDHQHDVRFADVDHLTAISIPMASPYFVNGAGFNRMLYLLDHHTDPPSWTRWTLDVGAMVAGPDPGQGFADTFFFGTPRKMDGTPAEDRWVWKLTRGNPDFTDPLVYDYRDGLHEDAVPSWYRTHWIDFDDSASIKRWKSIRALVARHASAPAEIGVSVFVDYSEGVAKQSVGKLASQFSGSNALIWDVTAWDDSVWSTEAEANAVDVPSVLRFGVNTGRSISISARFEPVLAGGVWELLEYNTIFKDTRVKP